MHTGGDSLNRFTPLDMIDAQTIEPNSIKKRLDNLLLNKKISPEIEQKKKEVKEVIYNLHQAKQELDIANNNFKFAQEQELIDYYIYQMKAAEARYQHLLKEAKEKKITISVLAEDQIQQA